jgi:hypothetical protein
VYQTHLRPDRLGKHTRAWIDSGNERYPEAVVCDHDTGNDGYQRLFEEASGLSLQLADKADRDKGIQETQARFDIDPDDGRPRIFFCENSRGHDPDSALVDAGLPTSLVEELVGYVWDEEQLKDEPIDFNDHALDQMRYVCRYVDSMMVAGPVGVRPSRKSDPFGRLPGNTFR